jgi:hypothetical protein
MVDYKESELDEIVFELIENVLYGIETKVFSIITEPTSGEKDIASELQVKNKTDITDLKTQKAMYYGTNLLEYYLNGVYKSLVDKSDPFMCDKFAEIGKLINIHPVYALNIISNVIMKVYPLCPRSKFVLENKEKYLDSVKQTLLIMKKYTLKIFNEDLKKLSEQKNNEKVEKEFN